MIYTLVTYFNSIEKQTNSSLIYKIFNCILVYTFVVYFNSIEKYEDRRKHTHKKSIFFRRKICNVFMKSKLKQCQNRSLLRFFFKKIILSVLKKCIFLCCLMRDLRYVRCFLYIHLLHTLILATQK